MAAYNGDKLLKIEHYPMVAEATGLEDVVWESGETFAISKPSTIVLSKLRTFILSSPRF
jgi:hypothetical protein